MHDVITKTEVKRYNVFFG